MGLLTLLLVSSILLLEANAALSPRPVCTSSTSSSATLPLHCPEGHVIHVQHWLTSLGRRGNNSECTPGPDCLHNRGNYSSGLLTVCNGLQPCNETVTVAAVGRCPNGTMPDYFQVQYECIPDNSTVTLCSDDIVTGNSTSLYVKTPAFPDGSDVTNRLCTCQVQGQGVSVTLLELVFPESGTFLSISDSTAEVWRYFPSSFTLLNKQVVAPGPQNFLNISFHDHGAQRQRAWLEVSASSGPLSIGCGANADTTSFSQPVTTTSAASTSARSSTEGSPGPFGTGSTAADSTETDSTETSSGSTTEATASTSPAETNLSVFSSSTTENSPTTTTSTQMISSGGETNPAQVELRCPEGQVLQVLGQVGALCQEASVDRAAPPRCVQPLPPSALRPSCNGRQLCNETVQVPEGTLCPDGTPPQGFNVSYACVAQTLTINICGDEKQIWNPVYLASPGFPGLLSSVSRPQCRCRVRGEGLTVTAVEVDLPSPASSSLSLSQARDGSTLWSSQQQQQSGPHFHTVLYSSSAGLQAVDITLNTSDAAHQRAWIQVTAAKGDIELACGVRASLVSTAPAPLTSSTVTPSASETASTERTLGSWTICSTQSNTSVERDAGGAVPASVVVLSVLCVLLAVALVVSNLYHLRGRLCRGKERDPTYAQREAPVPEDTPTYTELRIYQNPAQEQST